MVFVDVLRQTNPTARILVRVRRVGEIEELERLGADEAIPSEFETSIELFVRLLTHLGVPRHVVRVQESLIRLDHYQALRGVGATPDLLAQARKLIMGGILDAGDEGEPRRGEDAGGARPATANRRHGAERGAQRATAADARRADAARGGGPWWCCTGRTRRSTGRWGCWSRGGRAMAEDDALTAAAAA